MAITEEKSLDNASKLQVPDPADLAKLKGLLSILADHGVDSGKQAVIALVVAHRMAKLLDIDRKEFKDIPASDRYKAFLVTSAYALCTYCSRRNLTIHPGNNTRRSTVERIIYFYTFYVNNRREVA